MSLIPMLLDSCAFFSQLCHNWGGGGGGGGGGGNGVLIESQVFSPNQSEFFNLHSYKTNVSLRNPRVDLS